MSSFVSAFLSFAIFVSSLAAGLMSPRTIEDTSDFTPVLRFFVASDSHVMSMGDIEALRMQKAIRTAYTIAENDEEYKSLDAVVFVGDITDDGRKDQFLGFKAAARSCLKDSTQLMAVLAKSHDGNTLGSQSLTYYSSISDKQTDFHNVVNGYHFIGLSASKTEGEHYSEYQRTWLREQLDAAVADDPTKPIFVVQHEHVSETVYGSRRALLEGWCTDYFRDILVEYPQIVNFSGHSHYPLNDPRSIWQDEFTAVGTGALYYTELTVDDVATVHPDGYRQVSTFWVVEADADNRLRMRGVDLQAGEVLIEYIIDNPADPANREYTVEKQLARASAPEFKHEDIKLKGVLGNYKVTVGVADSTDGMPIFIYRANVYAENGTLISQSKQLTEYFKAGKQDEITIDLGKIDADSFRVEVVAENAYGMQSEPLVAER